MAFLNFSQAGTPGFNPLEDKLLHILCEFLQPNTASIIVSTAQSVLDCLPVNDQQSRDVASFGATCVELAEQIPYHYPSMPKLVALIEYLGLSKTFVESDPWKAHDTRHNGFEH